MRAAGTLHRGRDADEDVRAPRRVRRWRGGRASRAAMGLVAEPGCGRGRPRTSRCSAASRCADLPVRIEPCTGAGMRTGTSAHLAVFGGGRGARTSRSAMNLAPGPDADGDVRAPRRVRRWRGGRASGLQWAWWQRRDADEDVRAPRGVRRRRGARTSRSALNLAPRPNADEDVRAPRSVRRRRGARTFRSALNLAPGPECGRGRPRTYAGVRRRRGARTSRSALNLAPRPECGRGRARTVGVGVRLCFVLLEAVGRDAVHRP